ncbi:hypothetical protein HGO40_02965 [Pseudomonas sp. CG7]|uniref:hypothetical protein n=1 Tax=Pseudomonas sp. CG7 TaxID=191007 RepID=UPI002033F954|nr:hypothetical protein [Pseudomonas sp. CG7]MCM2459464.1 hypothetical protein [Pseudomonas sp. CG7]
MTCKSKSPELAAPTLANAHPAGINIASAAHLEVAIAPYPGMDAGDLIELFWDDCYVGSRVLSQADVLDGITMRIPESFIVNGTSRIHYRVMRVGRGPALSTKQRVQVKLDCPGGQPSALSGDENQGLAPVRIPATIRRQGVNPNQIKRGVPLTIEPYLNMAAGDAVPLRWGDVRMDLPAVTASDVGQPINIWVPPQIILEAGEDLRLEVPYCVLDRVGNNSHWAPPRTLKIGCANSYLDTSPRQALMVAETRRREP